MVLQEKALFVNSIVYVSSTEENNPDYSVKGQNEENIN